MNSRKMQKPQVIHQRNLLLLTDHGGSELSGEVHGPRHHYGHGDPHGDKVGHDVLLLATGGRRDVTIPEVAEERRL